VIDRRRFISGLAMGTLAGPIVASAQSAHKVALIGVLGFLSPTTDMTRPEPQSFYQRVSARIARH
jgi:hypothetical protein